MTTTITTLSSRQFNQDTSQAKKAAKAGPVFITNRGQPAHVLLTFQNYQKITHTHPKIADLLAIKGGLDAADIPFETNPARDLAQPADLS